LGRMLLRALNRLAHPCRSLHTSSFFLFLTLRRPPTSPLFPYTTLFRSLQLAQALGAVLVLADLGVDLAHQVVEMSHLGCGALDRSEEHTSELQSRGHLVCRLLLEKKKDGHALW